MVKMTVKNDFIVIEGGVIKPVSLDGLVRLVENRFASEAVLVMVIFDLDIKCVVGVDDEFVSGFGEMVDPVSRVFSFLFFVEFALSVSPGEF